MSSPRPGAALGRLLDTLALLLAYAGAILVRFHSGLLDAWLGPPQTPTPLADYLFVAPVMIGVTLLAGRLAGAWQPDREAGAESDAGGRALSSLRRRLVGLGLGWLALLALLGLMRELSLSRAVLLLTPALTLPLLGLVSRLHAPLLDRLPGARRRSLLIAAEPLRSRLADELGGTSTGRELITADESVLDQDADDPWPELDPDVDEVLLALPLDRLSECAALEARLRRRAVDLHVIIDPGDATLLRPRLSSLAGRPLLTLRESPGQGWNHVFKRSFDVVFAALLLIPAAPLIATLAALIRLESRGPALFRQVRISWGGREFTMIKLRTMRLDAEAEGARMAARDDPRRTRVGAFLRRTSLDELPQLWNVLRGDMSLVGPRPERPEFLPEITERLPAFPLRQSVKAGMTGWAQIHGQRGDAPLEDRLRYDLEYIRRWSVGFDLEILALTICGGFLSRNAI